MGLPLNVGMESRVHRYLNSKVFEVRMCTQGFILSLPERIWNKVDIKYKYNISNILHFPLIAAMH